jgi:hypothetical protein
MKPVPRTQPPSSFEHAAPRAAFSLVARIGFLAKGIVYLLAGLLTLRAAVEGGAPRDEHAAVQAIGAQPAGQVLLVLIGIGLGCYALFRVFQAILATKSATAANDLKDTAKRVGRLASGLLHGALAVTAVQLARGHHSGSGEHEAQTWAGKLLEQPFGSALLLVIGGGVLIAGVVQLVLAVTTAFRRELDLSRARSEERRWTIRLGRIGYSARGVVFVIMGVFAIRAAVLANAAEVEGMSGALRKLQTGPYGFVLLSAVATGLALYGVFMLVSSRYVRSSPS